MSLHCSNNFYDVPGMPHMACPRIIPNTTMFPLLQIVSLSPNYLNYEVCFLQLLLAWCIFMLPLSQGISSISALCALPCRLDNTLYLSLSPATSTFSSLPAVLHL